MKNPRCVTENTPEWIKHLEGEEYVCSKTAAG